jgi:hypothetical protein
MTQHQLLHTHSFILFLLFQFWGPAPQGATYFLLPVTAGPAPQGATYFLFPVTAGPRGLSPWAQTQILLRGLLPIATHFF